MLNVDYIGSARSVLTDRAIYNIITDSSPSRELACPTDPFYDSKYHNRFFFAHMASYGARAMMILIMTTIRRRV